VDWLGELGALVAGGQLMYYALGFIATAAWLLLMEIRRPRILIPFLGLSVVVVVLGVAITIGIDPNAQEMNFEAFRTASYTIFVVSLATYFATTILKAWQPSLNVETANRVAEAEFVDKLGKELGQS
jgi:membrane-bound ClpP family serine protease